MFTKPKAQKLIQSALSPQNLFCHSKHLFVFSHMRSRSTLLTHILGSNPEICGYNELHQSYDSPLSLLKMRVKLNNDVEKSFKDKFLLDKILHNGYLVTDQFLSSVNPKVVFLLRNPESSLQSIIRMGAHPATQEYANPYIAVGYYSRRLIELASYAQKLERNYFFIESDDLLNKPDIILNNLSLWLNLKVPLYKNYSTFKKTGRHGFGDMSDHIKAGTIYDTGTYPKINFPMDVLYEAQKAYDKCKETLTKNQSFFSASAPKFAQTYLGPVPSMV